MRAALRKSFVFSTAAGNLRKFLKTLKKKNKKRKKVSRISPRGTTNTLLSSKVWIVEHEFFVTLAVFRVDFCSLRFFSLRHACVTRDHCDILLRYFTTIFSTPGLFVEKFRLVVTTFRLRYIAVLPGQPLGGMRTCGVSIGAHAACTYARHSEFGKWSAGGLKSYVLSAARNALGSR